MQRYLSIKFREKRVNEIQNRSIQPSWKRTYQSYSSFFIFFIRAQGTSHFCTCNCTKLLTLLSTQL